MSLEKDLSGQHARDMGSFTSVDQITHPSIHTNKTVPSPLAAWDSPPLAVCPLLQSFEWGTEMGTNPGTLLPACITSWDPGLAHLDEQAKENISKKQCPVA